MMIQEDKYIRAQKTVAKQKNFYNHLQLFVLIMLIIMFFSNTIFNFFENHIANPNTLKWAKANIWVNSLLWGIGLLIYGIYVFKDKFTFIENWEREKIKSIMNENE
ncbi:2TM domain-containing protein [uncultured Tenacibaculum sp.]|uniref:2TM domain-containing protein n=1 Tax=uncultured Tenacibaculum sp. TaxID=174713 RepID=UPI0026310280|nr:2TM domain-containing protein [uncultured Tenacibaculum sp.]